MKPNFLLLILLTSSLIFTTSCEKDKSGFGEEEVPVEQGSLLSKIIGKWQVKSIMVNDNFGGVDHKVIYPGKTADYIEFKTNGKMHTYFQGVLDISAYKIKEERYLTIDDDPASVQELTPTTFRLYSRDETGTVGFTEVMYSMQR